MINVVLLGYGNVGHHLHKTFNNASQVEVVQIYNRKPISNEITTPTTTSISDIQEADIYIIAVLDDAISEVSTNIPYTNKLVVHTSGAVPMNALSTKNFKGVFYPLQTFTKNKTVDFSKIPICIEAQREEDLNLLRKLGQTISNEVHQVSSKERIKLHAAAVFVNNFVNYLYQIGQDILKPEGLSFDLLKPLIIETALKIENQNPEDIQTGPAKRNDVRTIQNHLNLLEDFHHKNIYQSFSKAIQDKYHGKKL